MKKNIFLSILAATAMLATSCSQTDDLLQPTDNGNETVEVVFNLQTPDATPQLRSTRAGDEETSTISRYVIEVYEGSDFAGIPTRYEKSDASFSLLLNKESQYMFLFWADYGTPDGDESNDCYNTASLKAVAPTDDAQKAEPAYFGKSETAITPSSSTPVTATLTHAVAKVILENIAGLVESTNSLEAVYPNYGSFDASTSGPATASGTITRTYNDIGAEAGVIVTDYILAPAEKELTNFSFTLNNEDAKAIGNVPLQINYATRIKGTFSNLYSTTFTIDQEGIEWIEDEGNDPDYNPNY